MKEIDWVETIAVELRRSGRFDDPIRIETQHKLRYGYEVREFGDPDQTEAKAYATDLIIVEDLPGQRWKPRVVIEAKVGSVTTHDAITYSQKASSHKSVCPFLRYGIMLGNRKHYPLPGRLYRHGENFDFMLSFVEYILNEDELSGFIALLIEEISASRTLEKVLYDTRKRDRAHYTKLHRKLHLGKAG